jgi:hypothetical protein
MAFKISKTDEATFTRLLDEARDAISRLSDFVSESIINRHQEELDEKSDKWREGEKGEAVAEWLSQWTDFMEELPEFNEAPPMSAEG